MNKLPLPQITGSRMYTKCTSSLVLQSAINKYFNAKQPILSEYSKYDTAANNQVLHTIPQAASIPQLGRSNLLGLYNNHLSKNGEPGRDYYDQLMAIPSDETCPLCNQRKVSTLDHHLPKSKYPIYSIHPNNLVACCAECNRLKGHAPLSNQVEQTLHPYYDDPNGEKWLFARILHGAPVAAQFFVNPGPQLSAVIASRIRFQFKKLELNKLYRSHAASEISQMKAMINNIRTKRGPAAVEEHLRGISDSLNLYHINHWKTALYDALACDLWVINNTI